jgi:hypothetical protein
MNPKNVIVAVTLVKLNDSPCSLEPYQLTCLVGLRYVPILVTVVD